MTDHIEPALTPEEWRKASSGEVIMRPLGLGAVQWSDTFKGYTLGAGSTLYGADAPKLIALLNAALPDTDPRKITRALVQDIRESARLVRDDMERAYGPTSQWGNVPRTLAAMAERAMAHADALESYLPPV